MALPPYTRRSVDPQAQATDLGQQIVSLLRASHSSPLVWIAALDVARALLPLHDLRRHQLMASGTPADADHEEEEED